MHSRFNNATSLYLQRLVRSGWQIVLPLLVMLPVTLRPVPAPLLLLPVLLAMLLGGVSGVVSITLVLFIWGVAQPLSAGLLWSLLLVSSGLVLVAFQRKRELRLADLHAMQQQQVAADLRSLLAHAPCLLWSGSVTGPPSEEGLLQWATVVMDDAAQTFMPLQMLPDEPYTAAWYRHRLPADQQRVNALALAAFLAGDSSYEAEFGCRALNGELRWFHERVAIRQLAPHQWYVTGVASDITARKQAEDALRESRARYRLISENTTDVIYLLTADNQMRYLTPSLQRVLGYQPTELTDHSALALIHPEDQGIVMQSWHAARMGQPAAANNARYRHADGSWRWIEATVTPTNSEQGLLIVVGRDSSERRLLESQLWHSQKLDTIGQMAGGIAHDFNNVLTAIQGLAELARGTLSDDGSPEYGDLTAIIETTERAAGLTRQLLAFARRQTIEPQLADLALLVCRAEPLIRRLIGDNIVLQIATTPTLPLVRVDPSQIEQVLLNLVVNARDAMPHGGLLHISLDLAGFDQAYAQQPTVVPGEAYLRLQVRDTGTGMDEDTLRHIFEPFFTTKPSGAGTGLGLATSYGIIRQHSGFIVPSSVPGYGTTMSIFLPLVQGAVAQVQVATPAVSYPQGDETVLVVEDDATVRKLAVRTLRQYGYEVLEASGGPEALRTVAVRQAPVDLLVTDVSMPEMTGVVLAARLTALHPTMKVLFTSGSSEGVLMPQGTLRVFDAFVPKPYSPTVLARKVRETLDSV